MYTLQESVPYNGKVIRYEHIASYSNFIDAYIQLVTIMEQDKSGLYNYRILDNNNKIIEESSEVYNYFADLAEISEGVVKCTYVTRTFI